MNYDKAVQDVIDWHKENPVDILGIGNAEAESFYLQSHKGSYIRTIRDIDQLFDARRGERNILEIGSYLGPVCIPLKNIGYNVSAMELPEYQNSLSLKNLYANFNIPFTGINLRDYHLPYESNSFDAVVICEVLEHLSFNPLPILNEINRVLKNGGYIYIGMPNQAQITQRFKLMSGKSVHDPVDHLFKQLDKKYNMLVGLHWREYTMAETIEMINRMGFETSRKYYYMEPTQPGENKIKSFVRRLVYVIPSFRPYQVVIGEKTSNSSYDFWLTVANS